MQSKQNLVHKINRIGSRREIKEILRNKIKHKNKQNVIMHEIDYKHFNEIVC